MNQPTLRHSQTIGPRGPVLEQDGVLHETLEEFVHEKEIERAVHTKGYGAFGSFTVSRSMAPYTCACFLQRAGQTVRTFSRFSLAVSNKGTPDTSRNVRGFSTKFYTDKGIFDLLCNHIPVFLVRDAIKFPLAIHALSPSPVNNLIDPTAFWRFVADNPESIHFVSWLYSDLGTLDDLRCLRSYGVNTYVWVNKAGVRRYVKYHWIPRMKGKTLDREEAVRLAGIHPDIAGQTLYDTLAAGQKVQYELCVQMMLPEEGACLPFDPLDDTKIWDEKQFPLVPVGRLTLERNPDNYKEQVERAAFSPANLTEGIELSDDKMLQGRANIYWDAQRRRIGPDFRRVPVNHEKNWTPADQVTSGERVWREGEQVRCELPKTDDFAQAGVRFRSLSENQRAHLVDNIAVELCIQSAAVRKCVIGYFGQADPLFGRMLQERTEFYRNQA